MKKVLIVGSGSYIGTSFLNAYCNEFDVSVIDSKTNLKKSDYQGFDSVIHVAGIAHVSKKKTMKEAYYRVNRDLAIHSALLAKEAGVAQFIFMSSMIIFGGDYVVGKERIITKDTPPSPEDFYGDSKLQADLSIQMMDCESFHTVVIRTPMVYGEGCRGNYPRMMRLSERTPILPKLENQRTVININRLIFFLQKYINQNSHGVFYPRDKEKFVTYKVMAAHRSNLGKKTHLTKFFNPLISFCSIFCVPLRKLFGTKIYSDSLPME